MKNITTTTVSTTNSAACSKYDKKAVRWLDKGDHYELIIMGDQIGRVLLTNIIMDMVAGDKSKEVHVFAGGCCCDCYSYDMILQQLFSYNHRIGIYLGRMDFPWLALLLTCQECYIPSEEKYHIESLWGIGEWYKRFNALNFLAAKHCEEKKKAKKDTSTYSSSDVRFHFTGQQLIEWGFAKDYNNYLEREIRHK